MTKIVLIGARSSLGAELITRLAVVSGVTTIYALHEGDALPTKRRFFDRVERHLGAKNRVIQSTPLDFREQYAGLPGALIETLGGDAVEVVLDLSTFDAGLSADEIEHLYGRAIDDIVALCLGNPKARIHVLSSLFVAGDRFGGFTEYDLDFGQRFACALDQARFTIEKRLRERIDAARLVVYRLPLLVPEDAHPSVEPVSRHAALVQAVHRWGRRAWADPRAVLPFAWVGYAAEFIERNVLDSGDGAGTFHVVESNIGMREFVESVAGDGPDLAWRPRAIRNLFARNADDSQKGGVIDCVAAVKDDFYTLWQADTFRFMRRRQQLGLPDSREPINCANAVQPEFDTHEHLVRILREEAALGLDGVYTLQGHDHRIVDDIQMDYWSVGDGPVIVLMPGVLGPESVFGLARRLRRDFQVIVPDTFGAMREQEWSDPEARLAREAALVKGLLAQLEIRKVARLVAFDLSVPVALYHQSRWPTATDGLLMVNPVSEADTGTRLAPAWKRWNRRSAIYRGLSFWVARHSIKLASRLAGFSALFQRVLPDPEGRMWRLNRRLAPDRLRFDRAMRALAEAAAMEPAQLTRARAPRALIWACDQALGTLSHGVKLLSNATNDEAVRLVVDAGIDVGEHKPRQLAAVIRESVGETSKSIGSTDGKVAGLRTGSSEARAEEDPVPARSVQTA